jgi:hypothetical protein
MMRRLWTRFRMNHVTVHAAILTLSAACVPYTVATTAKPVPQGESVKSLVVLAMPPVGLYDQAERSFLSTDLEIRRGIDSVSDWGLRFPSFAGAVVNYKRLLTRVDSPVLASFIAGTGFVNLGNHAHFEETFLISRNEQMKAAAPSTGVIQQAPPSTPIVPYAGLRVMQVVPMNSESVHDKPTVGGFGGLRFGKAGLGVSLEIGVFHDPSALNVRTQEWVVVPAIAIHGDELIDRLRPPRPRTRPRW